MRQDVGHAANALHARSAALFRETSVAPFGGVAVRISHVVRDILTIGSYGSG